MGRITLEQTKTDRTKAALAALDDEHLKITSLIIELKTAAGNDPAVADCATRIAAHSFDGIAALFPATIVPSVIICAQAISRNRLRLFRPKKELQPS
jgi:hypothetical protein